MKSSAGSGAHSSAAPNWVDLLNGARYARNLVHHHWADALSPENAATLPATLSLTLSFSRWAWRNADELPVPRRARKPDAIENRAAYQRRLAGERAADTLRELRDAFADVGTFLDPPGWRDG